MKFTHLLFFLALALAGVVLATSPNLSGALFAGLFLFVIGALLNPQGRTGHLCTTTLTVAEITTDVLKAYKKRVPALNFFTTSFSADRAKYGQTVRAHIAALPTAYNHTAANGYNDNAQSARGLLTDVDVVMNVWKDVPIKLQHADVEQDRSMNYLKTIDNAGYVLAKAAADYALTKVIAANFTYSKTETIGNTTKTTLTELRGLMNGNGAGAPRRMLCNSDFATALDGDARITSQDYYNQRSEADPYLHFRNVAGFTDILEYPDFPTNSENLSAFGFDQNAIVVASRLPEDSTALARQLGIPVGYNDEVVQDPDTGLALQVFSWIDLNTHYIYITYSVMYGAVAGAQGGSQNDLTDKSGYRIITAA